MTDDLIIRTPNGDFDLFGNEDIVQTISIFNLEDITSRSGEYTNLIKFPLTNNNRRIIEYADYMTSINTLPYRKVNAQIIVKGLVIKNGFIAIPEVSDVISGRFFSGNTVFYDLIKSVYLSDLTGWSAYDHVWNLTNAVASSANTSGYTYPVMDYNGQTLSGDVVDIRKILPATYAHTAIEIMVAHFGYTYVEDFGTTSYNRPIIPYVNKNPVYPASYLLLNSMDASKSIDTGFSDSVTMNYSTLNHQQYYIPLGSIPGGGNVYRRAKFDIFAAGTGTYWDSSSDQYNVHAPGVYTYNVNIQASATYNFVGVTAGDLKNDTGAPGPKMYGTDVEIILYKVNSNSVYQIQSGLNSTGISWSGSEYMGAGDFFYIEYRQYGTVNYAVEQTAWDYAPYDRTFYVDLFTDILDTSTFVVELDPSLSFGNPIVYSSILPRIKCSDLIKDIAIRFGIILSIDDDNKTVTATNVDVIKSNMPIALDLSDKLDETTQPIQQFSLSTYAQRNNFKHAEDKSVVDVPDGTDYTLLIDNTSLEVEKDLYVSPFAASENVEFNSIITTKINLYNTTTGKFDKDVKPRICFREQVTGLFKFTDGTTTSGYINTNRIWFIDYNEPDKCMGFGTSLIPQNSQTIIDILQNLRLAKVNLDLNIIDVKNINCLIPIKLSQYNSYFIISSINQFNYTKSGLTEVDLIKLN